MDDFNDNEEILLTLTDDNGDETVFVLIAEFCVDDCIYRAIIDVDDPDEEIVVMRVEYENDEEFMYEIASDEEWERACEAYEQLVMSQEDNF